MSAAKRMGFAATGAAAAAPVAKKKVKKDQEVLDELSQRVELVHEFPSCLFGMAALALDKAFADLGLAAEPMPTIKAGMFGPETVPFAVAEVTIPGTTQTLTFRRGSFQVPDLGIVAIQGSMDATSSHLICRPEKTGYDEALWKRLIEAVDAHRKSGSPFKGHAMNLRGHNHTFMPSYIDTSLPLNLIMNPDVEAALNDNLWHVIQHREAMAAAGVRLKRGVVMHGHYGAGKTISALRTAQLAREHGWTFWLAPAKYARFAFEVALVTQPSVLFIEDLDSVTHGNRDGLNGLLNSISGIESKGAQVILMVSTNFVDRIDPGFLRPERLDALIEMTLPTADTVARLLNHQLRSVTDLTLAADDPICQSLAGCTPAIISEVAERCRIRAVAYRRHVTMADLLEFDQQMARQKALASPRFVEDNNATKLEQALHDAIVD